MDNKEKKAQKLTDEDLAQANGGALFDPGMAEENPRPQVGYTYEVGQIVYVYGCGNVNDYHKAQIVARWQSPIDFCPEYRVFLLEGNDDYQIVGEHNILFADL